jgi:hypothetical protein
MNKSIAKAFEYIVRYTNIQDQQERYDTFYKVLTHIEKEYKYITNEDILLIKSEIQAKIATILSY